MIYKKDKDRLLDITYEHMKRFQILYDIHKKRHQLKSLKAEIKEEFKEEIEHIIIDDEIHDVIIRDHSDPNENCH